MKDEFKSDTQIEDGRTATKGRIRWLDWITDILDSRFRIPFTRVRFGVDFLVGLVPSVGDIFSLMISLVLIIAMIRYGAGGKVLVKMIGNVLLDAIVGTIPVIGDIFDLRYRANTRNLILLEEYHEEGLHKGSAWSVILIITTLVLLIMVCTIYFCIWATREVIHFIIS